MGRTHGVHAEPITFGLKLAVWWAEMRRHRQRLLSAREGISVGKLSGPVGTHASVPPIVEKQVCKTLGLSIATFTNQVIQRDRHAEFVTALALISSSLEKFATEIRNLQRTEIREVEEPFQKGQTGSSSMPHKRNPELSERVCGLARLIRGHAVTAMENVALWGERDISHSSAERIILPDACIALDYILDIFTRVISDLQVRSEQMMKNLGSSNGVIFSQRLLLSLVEHGMAREEAYEIVQQLSMCAFDEQKSLKSLATADKQVVALLSHRELDAIFDYASYVIHVEAMFENSGILRG